MSTKKKQPYISAQRLCEYSEAGSIRRRQIVKSFHADKDYSKLWYNKVNKALPKFIESGYDESILQNEILKIEALKSGTEWTDADYPNSIEALKRLKDILLPDLSDYDFVNDIPKLDHIVLGDVKVNLKPSVYLRSKTTGKVGAIKTSITKTDKHRLTEDNLELLPTLLKYGFIESGLDVKEIDKKGCIGIDVMNMSFAYAPSSYKLAIRRLEASCEEYNLWWQSL